MRRRLTAESRNGIFWIGEQRGDSCSEIDGNQFRSFFFHYYYFFFWFPLDSVWKDWTTQGLLAVCCTRHANVAESLPDPSRSSSPQLRVRSIRFAFDPVFGRPDLPVTLDRWRTPPGQWNDLGGPHTPRTPSRHSGFSSLMLQASLILGLLQRGRGESRNTKFRSELSVSRSTLAYPHAFAISRYGGLIIE